MILLAAIVAGAVVGGIAALVAYSAKRWLRGAPWSWADAAAATIGGVVGGALFPPLMVGLVALGLPTAAAYVIAGGIAWGGLWTLAQDAASWAFGRTRGLGSPSRYALSTAIGLLASALLLPLAARTITPAGLTAHGGTAAEYLIPDGTVNIAKAQGEFFAYSALGEASNSGLRSAHVQTLEDGAPPAASGHSTPPPGPSRSRGLVGALGD